MIRTALLFLLFGLMPATAQSTDCATAMAQQDLNICARQEWQVADAALNGTYRQVVAATKAIDANLPDDLRGAEAALRKAQRAWISFRDTNCAVEGFRLRGGSAEPMVVYSCLRQMTEARTAEFLGFLEY